MRAARPAEGVGWAGEACAASQRATRGGSRQSRRRLFERLEQEDQRLKKHVGRWDGHPTVTAARIVCSLTKPCVNKSASKSVACTAHLLLFL